jgi:hypothetical protein
MHNLSIHRILTLSAMHPQAEHIWLNLGRTQNVRLGREYTHKLANDEWCHTMVDVGGLSGSLPD